jgi:hypothetical protein
VIELGPRKTGIEVSLALPFSGYGVVLLLLTAAFFGVLHFVVWITSDDAASVSSAMVVVFALLRAAYFARTMFLVAEASADGADLAPGAPDPRAVEEIFGAIVGLVGALFFSLLPFAAVEILDPKQAWIGYAAIALGALYFPMAMLGIAVRGQILGGFPNYVLGGILGAPVRYFPSAVLTAGGGFLILACFDGTLDKFPIVLKILTETIAGWLLFAALHRAGVVHREEKAVQRAIPVPNPDPGFTESTTPSRPMSDIERMLLEREKEREKSPPSLPM